LGKGETMISPEPGSKREHLDEATSRRLAKLRAVQIDTSGISKAIDKHISSQHSLERRWFSPVRAAAASFMVLALITVAIITASGGPQLVSADQLAHTYEEVLVAGGNHVTKVESIEAANAALAARWPGAPKLPELGENDVMSCCIHPIGRKKMICVAFQTDGVPVTMAVANASDVRVPVSKTMTLAGTTYHVQSHGNLNMVMTTRDTRWVCLMGELPPARLAELGSSMRL
jgi:hypothetical protein